MFEVREQKNLVTGKEEFVVVDDGEIVSPPDGGPFSTRGEAETRRLILQNRKQQARQTPSDRDRGGPGM